MIFPFEKDTPRAEELLRRTGFVAKVQSMGGYPPAAYYRLRGVARGTVAATIQFSVIFRDSIDLLSRDRMLALATLGMPIVALAHPRDLALRRFRRRRSCARCRTSIPVADDSRRKSRCDRCRSRRSRRKCPTASIVRYLVSYRDFATIRPPDRDPSPGSEPIGCRASSG